MKNTKVLRLTQLGILIAIEAILAFTPIGFIMIPPIAITILHIPVIISGVLLGYSGGAIVGFSFGLMSMIRAMMSGSVGDMLFNPAASGNPLASIVLCIVPRILLGVFAALIFNLLRKVIKNDYVPIITASIVATALHTIMVLGCLFLFFSAIPLKEVFTTMITLNGIVEISAAAVIVTAICKPLLKRFKTQTA